MSEYKTSYDVWKIGPLYVAANFQRAGGFSLMEYFYLGIGENPQDAVRNVVPQGDCLTSVGYKIPSASPSGMGWLLKVRDDLVKEGRVFKTCTIQLVGYTSIERTIVLLGPLGGG